MLAKEKQYAIGRMVNMRHQVKPSWRLRQKRNPLGHPLQASVALVEMYL